MHLIVLGSVYIFEARGVARISPTLEPLSSKQFFGKDYPSDRRPSADNLHFGHPYPVIQDNGEFDKDFVADENSDNGHWKAQEEYDRLRGKLVKEHGEAEKALEKKREEERELKEATEEYERELAKAKKTIAKKEAEVAKAKARAQKANQTEKLASEPSTGGGWSWKLSWKCGWWPWCWGWPSSNSNAEKTTATQANSGVGQATEDTEEAMTSLDKCRKELEAARSKLKKLMENAEKARAKQEHANGAVEKAKQKELDAEKEQEQLGETADIKKAQHAKAEAEYLKQKAAVEAMQKDLAASATKVEKFRDAEDSDGGVYNTVPARKSGAMSAMCFGSLVVATAFCLHFA